MKEGSGPWTVHSNFAKFYRAEVLRLKLEYPNSRSLNGKNGEGSGEYPGAVGYFKQSGKTWVVNDDTWFEPLDRAFFFGADTSFAENAPRGPRKRSCLILTDDVRRGFENSLRQSGENPRFKHMYIFEA
jgi:hypothetical protein